MNKTVTKWCLSRLRECNLEVPVSYAKAKGAGISHGCLKALWRSGHITGHPWEKYEGLSPRWCYILEDAGLPDKASVAIAISSGKLAFNPACGATYNGKELHMIGSGLWEALQSWAFTDEVERRMIEHGLKPSIHLMHRLPYQKEKEWGLRLVVPGVDSGGAVYLEARIERETQAEALQLLFDVARSMSMEATICECQKDATPR